MQAPIPSPYHAKHPLSLPVTAWQREARGDWTGPTGPLGYTGGRMADLERVAKDCPAWRAWCGEYSRRLHRLTALAG